MWARRKTTLLPGRAGPHLVDGVKSGLVTIVVAIQSRNYTPARPAAARSTKNLLRKETMSQSEQVIGFVVKEEGVGDAGDRGGGGATLSAVAPLSGLLLAVASASTGQV
jgi:hypothetical protein